MNRSLREFLAEGGAFQGYAYAYPHKTAYRQLATPRALKEVWELENKDALFLYAHVPFCEMRCGFCNLFTTTHPGADLVQQYLKAMERQTRAVANALGDATQAARLAIGGGTPTFLSEPELERLLGMLAQNFHGLSRAIPKAIEASPATVTESKLALLRTHEFTRVSLGVQSFVEAEVRALGRTQQVHEVRQALGLIAAAGFKCLNVDLIYGIAGQTLASWRRSLGEALEFAPQEIYLYPLYVRPLTHLDRTGARPTDLRLDLYRAGRDYLLQQGYRQISMRLFRKLSYNPPEGPVYCCQEDGMVGLGPGARSYTASLHYSSEYAVGRPGVLEVITDFNQRTSEQFSQADYGCELELDEQKRRYVLKSLLRTDGLDLSAYESFFSTDALADFPRLAELSEESLAIQKGHHLQLNASGLELSDVIGPWLWSPSVREKMDDFALK